MTTDDPNKPLPPLPEDIQQSLEKLNLQNVDALRSISVEEILYLLDRCPFLQIVSMGQALPFEEPQFITAKTGWVIHHYGDAMSSSPGELLFGGGDFRILLNDDDDDGGDTGIVNPGKGTIIRQAFDTAGEMIALAKQLGWAGVKLVDGHPLMMWAAWMQATDEGYPLEGYEPSEKDRKKRGRIKRSQQEDRLRADKRPRQR